MVSNSKIDSDTDCEISELYVENEDDNVTYDEINLDNVYNELIDGL